MGPHRPHLPAAVKEYSVNAMWTVYLREAKEYDNHMAEAWKEGAKGFLAFSGLFSVIVTLFLIEGYKKLSPNLDDRNTFQLCQISQQLAGLTNGTYIPLQDYSSPPPTNLIVWVNALWLLSLVLSVMSALSATLILQWAHRYLQLPRIPSVVSEQARVRSFLFFGAYNYDMINSVEISATLLHFSVFLFFAGLMILFFTIYKAVAIVGSISVGLFAVAYLTLTILPCIDYRSPYITPMSSVVWYLWHTSLSSVAICLRWFVRQLHGCLVPYNLGEVTSLRQRVLSQWLQTIEDFAKNHRQCLKEGFARSIVRAALESSVLLDLKAVSWLCELPGLAEQSKIEEFVACIPGNTIVKLMNGPIESGEVTFRQRLLSLLRSCAPGAIGLDEDMRRRRLLVCLDGVHHILRASISSLLYGASPSESVLHDVRTNFANIGLMRTLWADTDPSIRIISRSICALLARHLLRKYPLEESELAWLQDVIGKPTNTIFNSLNNPLTVDAMNLEAYAYDVLSRQTDDLTVELATPFLETLSILTAVGSEIVFRKDAVEHGISALIQRALAGGQDNRLREVAGKLRRIYELVSSGAVPELQTPNHANRQEDQHESFNIHVSILHSEGMTGPHHIANSPSATLEKGFHTDA
ncbi:hypothetical protein F5148DRAFT_1283878 [Russula earlei]|uniref:Uncharacterized protein n=1 Tax=Russula earlei TaxID=71964 RepID=A0ACC0UBG8_9AGAM|nr:hypothetical protein F5148DRAFT_1283878 [Russula earlei]